ncbi:hypothetical protein Ancab_029862 [Ancistrocladus abbreviatus]
MPSRPIPPNPKPSSICKSKVLFLAISISAAAVIILTLISILYHFWYSLVRRSRTSPFDSITPLKLQKFTYKELKSATNKFSPENSIGKGGSGTVFRGILRDGKSVAIKKLDASSLQVEREFQNELTILGGIRSPYIVALLGYCIEKNKRLLVYEYMPNRSLQELLFSDGNFCVSWQRRFQIIQDVAKALEFLHNDCDPPVIHGDVKPSNVLLDWDFRAKISDFGLSRMKEEVEYGVEMFSQDLGKSQELSGNLNVETVGNEVDFALALQASGPSKNKACHNSNSLSFGSLNCFEKTNDVKYSSSPKGKEVLSVDVSGDVWRKSFSYDDELSSIEHSKESELNPYVVDATGNAKQQWGKDWWWKQDGSGELCSKDYVTEWIGSQICPTASPDWEEDKMRSSNEPNLEKFRDVDQCQLQEFELGHALDVEQKDGKVGKKKPRKMLEWWKEEHLDEMSRKGSRRKSLESKMKKKKSFKLPHFHLGRRFYILRRRKYEDQIQHDHGPDAEISFRRGWKRKKTRSMGSEVWSGDIFSRELSSTTSMRGTLCYVAPEYGGCGYLVEKADIYSLGVLILVIISGRRPLHVLNSPMKLEKANLVSWCRQLAQSGNILELVDERLKDAYDREQATLCINLGLACLQRMPELRPDIGDIVRILRGEMDLPPLPFEFSPSPPSKFFSRSRRKQKANAE